MDNTSWCLFKFQWKWKFYIPLMVLNVEGNVISLISTDVIPKHFRMIVIWICHLTEKC